MTLQIQDETEQTITIICNQRAYTIPKDVADSHQKLVDALNNIALLYEENPEATAMDLASCMYDARCIARKVLSDAGVK